MTIQFFASVSTSSSPAVPFPPPALPCGQAHSGQWEAELHVIDREGQAWPEGAGRTGAHVTTEPRPWQLCDTCIREAAGMPPAATLVTPSQALCPEATLGSLSVPGEPP